MGNTAISEALTGIVLVYKSDMAFKGDCREFTMPKICHIRCIVTGLQDALVIFHQIAHHHNRMILGAGIGCHTEKAGAFTQKSRLFKKALLRPPVQGPLPTP